REVAAYEEHYLRSVLGRRQADVLVYRIDDVRRLAAAARHDAALELLSLHFLGKGGGLGVSADRVGGDQDVPDAAGGSQQDGGRRDGHGQDDEQGADRQPERLALLARPPPAGRARPLGRDRLADRLLRRACRQNAGLRPGRRLLPGRRLCLLARRTLAPLLLCFLLLLGLSGLSLTLRLFGPGCLPLLEHKALLLGLLRAARLLLLLLLPLGLLGRLSRAGPPPVANAPWPRRSDVATEAARV